ncbi:MAG: peptidoglycan editing factor PgeF [Betaproteobacteria bacterium]
MPTLTTRIAQAGLDWIVPDWTVPGAVQALVTTRMGGASLGGRCAMDLGGAQTPDETVAENRRRLRRFLPADPQWLRQEHGTTVAVLDATSAANAWPAADAAVTRTPGVVCAVRMADCLPVFLADARGDRVAVAHAGWRGLAAGVITTTLAAMERLGSGPERVVAWLGPAIGPAAFEVGPEVRDAFCLRNTAALPCFTPGRAGKWHADLYALAALQLRAAGVHHWSGGGWCTHTDARRFFSYRRERDTGRMAALIWLSS